MNPPYSEGPMNAAICFVGEAPGEDEVRYQRPFVGAAGRLFDQLLSSAGIVRSLCRIDNVIQERPPKNDITKFIKLGKGGVSETPAYLKYRRELILRLQECKANVIVPLGNVALYALTGLKEVTKRRGSILTSPDLPGKKIIPTIHPAMALRMFMAQRFIVIDLNRIHRECTFPEIRLPHRECILSPHYTQILDYIKECNNCDNIAFDLEVHRNTGQVTHISLAQSPTNGICIPFFENFRDNFDPGQETTIWRAIGNLMMNHSVTKWAHNAIFDLGLLYRHYGITFSNIGDTYSGIAVLYPDFPKGLDFLTSVYCEGEPYYKDDGKLYIKNTFGDDFAFRRYNIMDSLCCLQASAPLMRDLERSGNLPTYQWKIRLLEPLIYAQEKGILMDAEGLRRASRRAERNIARLEKVFYSLCGRQVNHRSPKQLQAYFYVEKKYPIQTKRKKTSEGSTSTITVDELALQKLSQMGSREADCLLLLRELTKAKSTYYDVKLDKDNRLRTSFDPVGTVNDRLSSRKTIFGTGANLQNQTGEMKRLMRPTPGYGFLRYDLGQAENRAVAYVANEPNMIKAFETGIDIHSQTAALILGIDISEVTKKERNTIGKPSNHGLNYGLGYRKFALMHKLPESHAKFIVERYHAVYSGVRQWHAIIQGQLRENRTLTNLYGRKRKFLDRWGDELYKQAYDYIPQSTVGTKINLDGIIYTYYNQEWSSPFLFALQVHDSVIYEIPLDLPAQKLADIAWRIKQGLERPLHHRERTFVIPADLALGMNLKDMVELKSHECQTPQVIANLLQEVFHIS